MNLSEIRVTMQVLMNKFSCAHAKEVYKIAIIRWRIGGEVRETMHRDLYRRTVSYFFWASRFDFSKIIRLSVPAFAESW